MNHKIHVNTLGCAKNIVDSEKILGQLKLNSFEIVKNINNADVSIINTCGFILDAKKESIDEILNAVELKNKGKLKKVIVVGCLSERYREDLEKEIPEVDTFFGTEAYTQILSYLNSSARSDYLYQRTITTPKHYAYLKISEGCNHKCSFCAIPLIRGKHRSVPIENLVKEADYLAQNGVKELLVVAQDSTNYGHDLYGKRNLSELLEKISEVEKLEWIKLLYTYPTNFPKDVLKTIANNPKINKYIDIPLQHISDPVLTSMKRGIKSQEIKDLIKLIRNDVPEIAIRSTFIVGYPNETEKDYEELYNFIEEFKLDNVGFFRYSQEENTPAEKLGDTVDEDTKYERYINLMELQREIIEEKNKSKIGQTVKVILDGKENGRYIARSSQQAPEIDAKTIVITDMKLTKGKFYEAEIVGYEDHDIIAKI